MVSRIPQSSKDAFRIIRDIIRMDMIDIPPQFRGTGAPGDTLEFLLNVKRNNYDSPDLKDWEVKFHGGKSLLTLLHKDPQPTGILEKIVDNYGWKNKEGEISFRHTIRGKSKRGFVVNNIGNKITATNINDKTIVPYWEHNVILNTLAAKLRRLILVHGTVSPDKRKVTYKSATAYWDLKLMEICNHIKEGIIFLDFDARTTKGRGTSLRNHGTKFRINIKNINLIYENSQVII